MATLYTHSIVGLGIASIYARRRMPLLFWGLAAFLPIVPDFDCFSSAYYGSPWGHRGCTHSLLFALWLGVLAASLTFRYFRVSFWSLSALFLIIVATHGLLDALTWGGAEIPFFWPSEARYGNWGPIPVSDIAFEFPDPRTSRAVRAELIWVWAPTLVVVAAVSVYRFARKRASVR